MAVDDLGGIYAFDGQVPALRCFDAGGHYVKTLGREGEVIDTIIPPRFPNEPNAAVFNPLGPAKVMGMSPLGHLIVGMNDDYTFDIRSPDGPVVRVKRDYDPVSLLPEEKADWQAVFDWIDESQPFAETGSVPDHKPPYAEFLSAQDGRIWVRRRVEGYKEEEDEEPPTEESNRPPPINWEERSVYDAFELDGTYLGEVRFPLRARPLFIGGDTAWGVYRGEFDEQYIAKMPIVQPPER